MEGPAPDSDEQFAEWYVWAKREVSSDPRICLGVAQAGIEALQSGADRTAAELAARKSMAGLAVVLLAKVSPWRQGYAQWYDWARLEFGGEPARLHRLTRVAIERLKSDGDADQAAEAARSAAAADPPASRPDATPPNPSGSSWTPGGAMNDAGWGGASFSSSAPWINPGPTPDFASASGAAARPALSDRPAMTAAGPVTLDPAANAGLGRRLGATVIDGVLGLVGAALVFFVANIFWIIAVISTGHATLGEEALTGLAVLGILAVLFWLYDAGLESSPAQATLGKRWVGLVVIDRQGRPISFARATARHLVKSVPLVLGVLLVVPNILFLRLGLVSPLFLLLGVVGVLLLVAAVIEFFMIAWTRRHQGLHDLVASTLVVRRDLLRVVPAALAPPPPPAALPEPRAPMPVGGVQPGEPAPRHG